MADRVAAMIAMTLGEIAAVVSGWIDPEHPEYAEIVVSGPAFLDSREPELGGLFLAIEGENVDGHEFAGRAVTGGAAAVLASRPVRVPAVVVADVQAAIGQLATHVLRELRARSTDLKVLAVTGSQGKTSVKDMLAHVLADQASTVATYGSFNNELGLPLTVLRAEPSTRFLVTEMGARGIGHIADLCLIASPDVSVVLNVGRAHLGEFGSQANIAIAKGELVEALGPAGVAVLNSDDRLVAEMASRTRGTVHTFGQDLGAGTRLADITVDDLGRASFELLTSTEQVRVDLRLLGAHQAMNAAAVAAAAEAVGVGLEAVAGSLGRLTALSKWRMELHERADGLVVINDAYNANPDSMAAALTTLAGIGASSHRQTVAVLGEMRELGPASEAEHEAIGLLAADLGIDHLYVVGSGARAIGAGYPGAIFVASVAEVIDAVRKTVVGTDVVLIKASRAAGLERVAEALGEIERAKETGQ